MHLILWVYFASMRGKKIVFCPPYLIIPLHAWSFQTVDEIGPSTSAPLEPDENARLARIEAKL